MIRHVSVFTLKDKSQINNFIELLKEIDKCPLVVNNQFGVNITNTIKDGPDFGDVIQLIDFNSQEELDAYPTSQAHLKLINEGPEMEKVTAIDYRL